MHVHLLMALTVDGKIARDSNHFPDWTGSEDKRYFAEVTRRAGVVVMGSRTFDTIGKPLPERRNIVLTRNRQRRSHWENLIFTGLPPAEILNGLERDGFRSAVLAGGATINTLFAQQNLIAELTVTHTPKVFGTGIGLFKTSLDLNLELTGTRPLGKPLIALNSRVLPAGG